VADPRKGGKAAMFNSNNSWTFLPVKCITCDFKIVKYLSKVQQRFFTRAPLIKE
jgi:hypothetical protein